jgi:hypothetical protein
MKKIMLTLLLLGTVPAYAGYFRVQTHSSTPGLWLIQVLADAKELNEVTAITVTTRRGFECKNITPIQRGGDAINFMTRCQNPVEVDLTMKSGEKITINLED